MMSSRVGTQAVSLGATAMATKRLVHTSRQGATLTEVLMSLLIMGVGVLSVFSLYPIAVTRSIQATQAVSAKLLFENAKAEILADPTYLNGAPPWRPRTIYRVGDVVTGVPKGSFPLAPLVESTDPTAAAPARRTGSVGYYICLATGVVRADPLSGTSASGAVEPNWPVSRGDVAADGGLSWVRVFDDTTITTPWVGGPSPITDAVDFSGATYVVDPLGWATHHRTAAVAGATTSLVRDTYGSAPRLDAGLRMLLDDGVATPRTVEGNLRGEAFFSRSLTPLCGSPVISVETAFRPLFRVASDNGPFSDFDLAVNNQELTPNQLRRVAIARTSLSNSYEADSAEIPLTPASFTAGGGTPARAVITLPAGPETQDFLTAWNDTVNGLEAAGLANFARVTISSASARLSQSRWLVSGYDDDLDGTTDVDGIRPGAFQIEVAPVSASFGVANDTVIRFEVFEPRYSWMATFSRVPSGGLTAGGTNFPGTFNLGGRHGFSNAKCVVFFRRPFETALEVGFNAQIGNDPRTVADDNDQATPPFDVEVAERNRSRAYIANGRTSGGVTVAPQIAVGRHLFDSVAGHWYRVESVLEIDPINDLTVVELDRPAEVIIRDADSTLSNTPGNLSADASGAVGTIVQPDPQVVIPQGIVRIFDLELGM